MLRIFNGSRSVKGAEDWVQLEVTAEFMKLVYEKKDIATCDFYLCYLLRSYNPVTIKILVCISHKHILYFDNHLFVLKSWVGFVIITFLKRSAVTRCIIVLVFTSETIKSFRWCIYFSSFSSTAGRWFSFRNSFKCRSRFFCSNNVRIWSFNYFNSFK